MSQMSHSRRWTGLGLKALAVLLFAAGFALAGRLLDGAEARAEPLPAAQEGDLLVTSTLGATSSMLFVVDPKARTLAVYEAVPGAEEASGLRLVGARKIAADLRLTRYRDQSEFSYSDLQEGYESGRLPGKDGSERDR